MPLLGNPLVLGEAFHITSDEAPPWNQVVEAFGHALGIAPRIVHVTSDAIAAIDREWGDSLLGDKTHSMVFDNSKIKSIVPGFAALVPYAQGAREIVEWHLADPARQQVDADHDALLDTLVERFG